MTDSCFPCILQMSILHVSAGISLKHRPGPPSHDKQENPPLSMESFLWGNALLAGVLLSVMCRTRACGWGAPYKVQSIWPSTLFAAGLSKDSLWAYMGCHKRKEEVEEKWEKQFPVCMSPCCAAKNVILLYLQCSKAVNCFLLKWAWRIKVCALLVIFTACWALEISQKYEFLGLYLKNKKRNPHWRCLNGEDYVSDMDISSPTI